MATRHLYMVRHGQYQVGKPPFDNLGPSLTALGRRQAARTAKHLKKTLPLSTIHTSTMRRALESATIIKESFPDLKMTRSKALWECIPSVPYACRDIFAEWPQDALDDHAKRARNAFSKYARPTRGKDRHELLVCHGNVIRYFMCRALRVSVDAWAAPRIHHCGISEFIVSPGAHSQVQLVRYNSLDHLPAKMRTIS